MPVWKNQNRTCLNCRCDTSVNITSPTQLQDGTTYDSTNIIHHIYMWSTDIYPEISTISWFPPQGALISVSEAMNFSLTGYEKFLPIF